MHAAEVLLRAIQNKLLLTSKTFEDLDEEEVWSGRDDREFEERWLRLFDQVKDANFSDAELQMINRLREATSKHAYDSELSGYVSDDFGVIYNHEY